MKAIFVFLTCFISFQVWSENSASEIPASEVYLLDLLKKVQEDRDSQALLEDERKRLFKRDLKEIESQLADAQDNLRAAKREAKKLKGRFDENEEDLAELEEELTQNLGNLGEMFGVVRQVSQDVGAIQENSILSLISQQDATLLNTLSKSKALPKISELEQLWFILQGHMTKQSMLVKHNVNVINQQGVTEEMPVGFVGPFVALSENGFLSFDAGTQSLFEMSSQPSVSMTASDYFAATDYEGLTLDPTRGTLLAIDSQSPGYLDRLKQGGPVGYIIVLLAVAGFVYGLYLLIEKLQISNRVNDQLENIDKPDTNNPLGRIISVYTDEREQKDLEILEMKLDEAVIKEMPAIEKGLSLIKLLAAVAPLLGLLGTVTGMIATFQSITVFGTSDPKLMASGISQALITTVLGLVAAIPLLFIHNIVTSRSKALVQILDQQAAGLIAKQAQRDA